MEAALIIGSAIAAAVYVMRDEPFCEACGNWCPSIPRIELQACDPVELKRSLEAKDLTLLESLGPRAGDPNLWLQVDIHKCKKCGLTNTLTIDLFAVTADAKNRKEKKRIRVVKKLLITSSDCDMIRRAENVIKPAPEPAGVDMSQAQSTRDPAAVVSHIRRALSEADLREARSVARYFLARETPANVASVAARFFLLKGNISRARKIITALLQQAPSAELYYLASQVALNQAQQVSFLRSALQLDPFHSKAFSELNRLYSSLGGAPVEGSK